MSEPLVTTPDSRRGLPIRTLCVHVLEGPLAERWAHLQAGEVKADKVAALPSFYDQYRRPDGRGWDYRRMAADDVDIS